MVENETSDGASLARIVPRYGWRDDSQKFLQYGGGSEYTALRKYDKLLKSPDCAAGAIRAYFYALRARLKSPDFQNILISPKASSQFTSVKVRT